MRLISPNPGECVDRQTILLLKCDAGTEKKLNVQPFVDEHTQIQTYLEKNWFLLAPKTIAGVFDVAFKDLKAVNKQLWDLEDEIRSFAAKFGTFGETLDPTTPEGTRALSIAFLVPHLNDKRAELVKYINRLFGIESQEKLYK